MQFSQRGLPEPSWPGLCLRNFASLDAAGAHANALGIAIDQRLHCLQVDVPAPLRYVVRVRNVVAKLRPFAANITYLCHFNLLQTLSSVSAPARTAQSSSHPS